MTFREVLEIIRRVNPEKPAGEVAIEINGYFKDICNYAEPLYSSASAIADGNKTAYSLSEFDNNAQRDFMKLRSVMIDGKPLREVNQAVTGDLVYEKLLEGVRAGTLNHDGTVRPLRENTEVDMVFYAYPPPVSVDSQELPLIQVHTMILWRTKADIHAEKREWDRAGYYNRRYERSLHEYRRMISSSGPQRTINSNDRI